jgi:hypothetical protein
MKKLITVLSIAGSAFLLCSVAACQNNPVSGREFTLSVGQTANIPGEDLEITFTGVTSDSRCPSDVVCVWAGEVVCAVEIEEGTETSTVDFIHSGNNGHYSQMTYGNYQYTFKVEPYPVSGQGIADNEYKLFLTVD